MSTYDNTGGDIYDEKHYQSGNLPLDRLESQSYDDEKGDPYVRELGNPDVEEIEVTSEGEEKEIGTGEREGN